MDIKRALTFRASSIGDSLMGKYFLENIHASYPNAQCVLLVAGKVTLVRDLLAAYPWIDVIEANTKHPFKILTAFKKVFPSDATVTQYSGRGAFSTNSKLFARLVTKQGRLVGFTDSWEHNARIYDHLIPFDARRGLRLLECDAVEAFGVVPRVNELVLKPLPGNDVRAKLGLSVPYVVVHLFSGSLKRGLTLEHQKAIITEIRNVVHSDTPIVLTGGKDDEPLLQSLKEVTNAVMIAPDLSMQALITLVSESYSVVSLDTGVGHIAAQTGIPLVILRTCWGYNWWNSDQYPRSGIVVLSHDDECVHGHAVQDYPRCLGAIRAIEVGTALNFALDKK